MALDTAVTPALVAALLMAVNRAEGDEEIVEDTVDAALGEEEISEPTVRAEEDNRLAPEVRAKGCTFLGRVRRYSARCFARYRRMADADRNRRSAPFVGSNSTPQPVMCKMRTVDTSTPRRVAMPSLITSASSCWAAKKCVQDTAAISTSTGTKTLQLPAFGACPSEHVSQSDAPPALHVPQSLWQSLQLPESRYLLAAQVKHSVLAVPEHVRQEASHAEHVPGLPPVRTYPSEQPVH